MGPRIQPVHGRRRKETEDNGIQKGNRNTQANEDGRRKNDKESNTQTNEDGRRKNDKESNTTAKERMTPRKNHDWKTRAGRRKTQEKRKDNDEGGGETPKYSQC